MKSIIRRPPPACKGSRRETIGAMTIATGKTPGMIDLGSSPRSACRHKARSVVCEGVCRRVGMRGARLACCTDLCKEEYSEEVEDERPRRN